MPNGNIFISYRRGPDSNAAGRLYDRLERSFDAEQLFFDIDSIPLGMDFAEHIDLKVAECDVQLVVIGPGWLANIDRLADQDDFVRIEVEAALSRDRIPVVPVLIDGATMPEREALPEVLQPLVRRNAIEIRHAQFAQTVDTKLAEALRAHVGDALAASDDAENGARSSSADQPHAETRPDATPNATTAPRTASPQIKTASPPARRKPLWMKALAAVVGLALLLVVVDRVWPDWRMTQEGVTGNNMMRADYGTGSFVQTADGVWSELKANGETNFTFREVERDDTSVYLCDPGRDAGIRLDARRNVVTYSETCSAPLPWRSIYTLSATWRKLGP